MGREGDADESLSRIIVIWEGPEFSGRLGRERFLTEKFSRPLREARFPAEYPGLKAAWGWGRARRGRMAMEEVAPLRRCSAFGNA